MPKVESEEVYTESEDFVPNPADLYGTLETTGLGGPEAAKLESVTPIFDQAKQKDLVTASRALDENDDEVDSSLVVLPEGVTTVRSDPDAARARIENKGAQAKREEEITVPKSRKPNKKGRPAKSSEVDANDPESQETEPPVDPEA